ncbi:MAG: protein kinase [Sandaracinaceae bacterium]
MQEFSRGHVFAQRYRVRARLGKGGMGSVYEAEEIATREVVALKVLSSELVEDARFVERFRREAEATARLAHPNIVRVQAFVHRPSEPALIVMERLRGEPLLARVKRGPLETKNALSIAMQLTDALGAAHRAGVVHRDLKPANVFLVPLAHDGVLVKLLDFGIAKLKESDGYSRLTQTGVLIGTPRYASPEQIRGDKGVDARSDVFSLGVLLYGMLAGRPPFTGRGAALLVAIQQDAPPPLESVSPALSEVVRTAMAKQREDRFASMEAFEAALRGVSNARPATTGSAQDNLTVPGTPAAVAAAGATPLAPAQTTDGRRIPSDEPPATRTLRSISSVPRTPARGTPRQALRAPAPTSPPPRGSAPRVSRPTPSPPTRMSRPSVPDATVPGLRGGTGSGLSRVLLAAGGLLVGLAVMVLAFVGAALWLRTDVESARSLSHPLGWSPVVDYLPSRAARTLGPSCVNWEYQDCGCMSLTPDDLGPCPTTLAILRQAASSGEPIHCQAQLRPYLQCADVAFADSSLAPGTPQWAAWAQLRASQYGPSCTALLARECSCDPDAMDCQLLEYDLHIAPGNDGARRRVLQRCAEVDEDDERPCP